MTNCGSSNRQADLPVFFWVLIGTLVLTILIPTTHMYMMYKHLKAKEEVHHTVHGVVTNINQLTINTKTYVRIAILGDDGTQFELHLKSPVPIESDYKNREVVVTYNLKQLLKLERIEEFVKRRYNEIKEE